MIHDFKISQGTFEREVTFNILTIPHGPCASSSQYALPADEVLMECFDTFLPDAFAQNREHDAFFDD